MRPIFPPWSNVVLWSAIALAIVSGIGALVLTLVWAKTPFATGEGMDVDQPVKFDHRHHARDDGIDCLYCHDQATRAPYAGVPPTSRCMGCHAQIWLESPELAPVRASWTSRTPIAWRRVNSLPEFVYFDHRIHVSKGVGCVTCHGRVDQMAQVRAARSLTMSWCLGCHRDPEVHLRPLDRITDLTFYPEGTPREVGRRLRRELDVNPKTDCTVCHR
jgi:hypothetical protein